MFILEYNMSSKSKRENFYFISALMSSTIFWQLLLYNTIIIRLSSVEKALRLDSLATLDAIQKRAKRPGPRSLDFLAHRRAVSALSLYSGALPRGWGGQNPPRTGLMG